MRDAGALGEGGAEGGNGGRPRNVIEPVAGAVGGRGRQLFRGLAEKERRIDEVAIRQLQPERDRDDLSSG
jgi:hypothetical protein